MWEILVILIVGYASANKNENYEIVSCNDPNKESLHITLVFKSENIGVLDPRTSRTSRLG